MNPLLLELQNLDLFLQKCTRERARLDDGTAARAARNECRAVLDSQQSELALLNKKRADFEDESSTVEAKIARQQERLMKASNAHEVTSFQRDIEAMNRRRGELDEDVLLAMDEVETQEKIVAQTQTQLRRTERETGEIEENFALQNRRLDNNERDTKQKRAETYAALDEVSRSKYDAYAKRLGGVAVVHPIDGNCSACGMEFTPFNLREAKKDEWPTCENCGRLLFV